MPDLIAVRMPMRIDVMVRVMRVLAAEFPDALWVDDPEGRGHFTIDVSGSTAPGDREGEADEDDDDDPEDDVGRVDGGHDG
jgi:hypothetical protein